MEIPDKEEPNDLLRASDEAYRQFAAKITHPDKEKPDDRLQSDRLQAGRRPGFLDDGSIWQKMGVGVLVVAPFFLSAFISNFVEALSDKDFVDDLRKLTAWEMVAIFAGMAIVVVLLGSLPVLFLSVKDVVVQRLDRGRPYHPFLWIFLPFLYLYFAGGLLSAAVWFFTLFILGSVFSFIFISMFP